MRMPDGVGLTDPRSKQSALVHGDCRFGHNLMAPHRTGVEIGHPRRVAGHETPRRDVCGASLELRPVSNRNTEGPN